MNYKKISLIISFMLVTPIMVLANTPPFTPLVGVPGLSANDNFSEYINALYILSISIAGLLAVIKMIIAGTKYMLSDIVTTKQDALGDIRGSIGGLIIVISAVLILQIINPQLINLNVFSQVQVGSAPAYNPGVAPPGGGSPIPGYVNPNLPEPKKVICTVNNGQNDSQELARACLNGASPFGPTAGRFEIYNNWFGSGCDVTCSYGRTITIPCTNNSLDGTWNCQEAINSCQGQGGTAHQKERSVVCVRPF